MACIINTKDKKVSVNKATPKGREKFEEFDRLGNRKPPKVNLLEDSMEISSLPA